MKPFDQCWSISQAAGLATLLEASAPKFGNVHPSASFSDMHFGHFVTSAALQSSCFSRLDCSVGELILSAVEETRRRVECNTNLGTLLLVAPLAIAAAKIKQADSSITRANLQTCVKEVLRSLMPGDSKLVYQAIRVANPGGLGKQSENDVAEANAPARLIEAMQQVASVDAVARQYVDDFADVFGPLICWLDKQLALNSDPLAAIQQLQLLCLAWQPDGLIIRKCGFEEAVKIQQMAAELVRLQQANDARFETSSQQFDKYLRADGNRRNPGTTADLIAATIFVRLICGA